MPPSAPADALIEASTMRRVTLRIVPFLMVCYFIAFVDRVNAGFAALQMNKDVGLSAAVFGLGGGLFFVAYVLCEVPSNLAMQKVGAKLWLARIMITWAWSRRRWRPLSARGRSVSCDFCSGRRKRASSPA
jgi:ACS family tartrate transporter-like MFS transporter